MHEPYEPDEDKHGRPIRADTGEPWHPGCGSDRRPYPWKRELGDAICRMCPRWNHKAQEPRPGLSPEQRYRLDVAIKCAVWKCLPSQLQDEDAELLDDLTDLRLSDWWRTYLGG